MLQKEVEISSRSLDGELYWQLASLFVNASKIDVVTIA